METKTKIFIKTLFFTLVLFIVYNTFAIDNTFTENKIRTKNSIISNLNTFISSDVNIKSSITTFLNSSLNDSSDIKTVGINNDANSTGNDAWVLGGNYGDYGIIDSANLPNKGTLIRTLTGSEISSILFGDFNPKGEIQLLFSGADIKCQGDYLLYISGALYSEEWGDLEIKSEDSYTCLTANSSAETQDRRMQILVHSDILGDKLIGGELNGVSATRNASVNTNIYINGQKQTNKSNFFPNNGVTPDSLNVQNIKIIAKTNLNIQGESLLNGRKPLKWNDDKNTISDLTALKDTTYYNYEGDADPFNASNENNKGRILELKKSNFSDDITNNLLKVEKQKTIIVKGGNIYINADVYNDPNDNDSILILIAKRDSTNISNGGNIYINPDVTNIDAVLIADGNVLSYNSIDKTELSPNKLRRQLLIYGQITSSNVTGTGGVQTWSDAYINGKRGYDPKYDIEKLRYFYLRPGVGECSSGEAPANGNGSSTLTYAWAGKRKCYINDGKTPLLRVPANQNTSPVILELHSINDLTNKPFIFRKSD